MSERFVIEKQISARRSADAFLAIDSHSNNSVRLVRIHSPLSLEYLLTIDESLQVTKHQLSNVQSDYVLSITDTGIDSFGAWLVTPYLDSKQLTKALTLPLELNEFYNLATQLFQALQRIHEKNMVHGALSINSLEIIPSETRNHYLITDLGMRKLLVLAQNEKALHSLPSDLPTLAPELFQEREATPQTDLYMAGQILYYLLAGGHPYVGLNPAEALNKHVTHELPLLHTVNSNIPSSVARWIDSLTQPNPDKRPLSALAARHELDEIYNSRKTNTSKKKPLPQAAKSNKKLILILSSVALLLCVGGFTLYKFLSHPSEQQSQQAIVIKPYLTGSVEGGTLSSTTKYFSIGSNNSSKKEAWGTKRSSDSDGPDIGSTWRSFIVFKASDILNYNHPVDTDLSNVDLIIKVKPDPLKYGRKTRNTFTPMIQYTGSYKKTSYHERRAATQSIAPPLLISADKNADGYYYFKLPKMNLSKLPENEYLFFVIIGNHAARKDESMTFIPAETSLEIISH